VDPGALISETGEMGGVQDDKQEVGQVLLLYQDQSDMKNERTISTKLVTEGGDAYNGKVRRNGSEATACLMRDVWRGMKATHAGDAVDG
jgi:hypothetical protein